MESAGRWFVRRNGETVGPVDHVVVEGWVGHGMTDAEVREEHGGTWRAVVHSPFVWRTRAGQSQRSAHPGTSTGTIIVLALGACVLLGGCAFIVIEPVMALAIFFVGIPFVALVAGIVSFLLPKRP